MENPATPEHGQIDDIIAHAGDLFWGEPR